VRSHQWRLSVNVPGYSDGLAPASHRLPADPARRPPPSRSASAPRRRTPASERAGSTRSTRRESTSR